MIALDDFTLENGCPEVAPGDPDSFTPFRPYLAHFPPVFFSLLCVHRLAEAVPTSRKPEPRAKKQPSSASGRAHRDDRAGVLLIEAVLGQAHEGGVLLDQQDELRIALHVGDAIDVRRDRLARHAHLRAVDRVAVLLVGELADHRPLVRRDHLDPNKRRTVNP